MIRGFAESKSAPGPDGSAYVLDWSDTGECHESNGVHRTSGRIFKISYGDPKASRTRRSRENSRRTVSNASFATRMSGSSGNCARG